MAKNQPERKDFKTDAEFDKAMQTWLEGQSNQAPSDKVSPSQATIDGVVTGVSREIGKDGKFFRFITIGTEQVLCAKVMYDNNAALLQVGNSIVAKCDNRIAGKTGYEADGKWNVHTGSGLSFLSATYSASSAEAKGKDLAKQASRVELYETTVSKISDAIANADAKDKQAIATAVSGSFRMEI